MAYSTKIKYKRPNSKKKSTSRRRVRRRNYTSKRWQKKSNKLKLTKKRKNKLKKLAAAFAGVAFLGMMVGVIVVLAYLQSISEDLPSPETPFGIKNTASEIYDRNGKLLYRVFGEENRDPVSIDEVPDLLIWAFLAAEDVDYYKHPGVDVPGIIRCGIKYVQERSIFCGGSTITQQLIKQTALSDERRLERKVKEVLMALQIENVRSKEEILEMYLTVAPEGSNIYGVTTAAQFYFGKELSELNLAEMAIIASIPQNPPVLSPTKSIIDPEVSKQRVKERQEYVLNQMERYMDQINTSIKEKGGGDEDALTQEMIDEAKAFELTYRAPRFDIKAPHFVFYAQKLLQERGYNQGEPFSLSSLETGGYKIYTTLDYDFQQIADEQVKTAVDSYGSKYGGENAALVAINPRNGEILAMAGSKDYFGKASPEGCTSGVNCKFEPNVNIADTLQSPGSSMKPMVYYMSMMEGLIAPGSILGDIPIQIGNYKPKNYEGGFTGIQSARWMLKESRNIPAIYLVDQVGVGAFVDEMKRWGYSTYTDSSNYGPSIAVGGSDIKLIDHAEAYSVFANEGKHTEHEVILKIEDKEGNLIYEYVPESEQIADARGTYLINHILNGKNGGPGSSWDGRDIAGKTGTSEDQKEVLFATYTPEIVAVGWLGNNDNTPMRYGTSGFRVARPWVAEFVELIGGSIPATGFNRPGGISYSGSCTAAEGANCEGFGGDIGISAIGVPSYVEVYSAVVCVDQTNRLARDIDISLGKSITVQIKYYKMPNPKMQKYMDAWINSKEDYGPNGVPEEYCDIDRSPTGDPWAVVSSPAAGSLITDTLSINLTGYSPNGNVTKVEVYFDGSFMGESTSLPYVTSFSVGPLAAGSHTVLVKVHDDVGAIGSDTLTLYTIGDLSITAPGSVLVGETASIDYSYSGSGLEGATLYVDGAEAGSCSGGVCTWDAPNTPGDVSVQVKGSQVGVTIESNIETITIT